MAKAVGAGQPPEVAGVPPEAVSAWLAFLPKLWPSLYQTAEELFTEQRNAQEVAMQTERAELAVREQSLRDTANAAQALLQSYEGDITLLRSKNQDLNEKVADMSARLADESNVRRRAEAVLEEIRLDFAGKETRFNDRIAEMESRMDTMRQEHAAALLAERRARTDELEKVHRTHEGELGDRNREIAELKSQIAAKSEALTNLSSERAELAGKAAQQEQENTRLYGHVRDLQEQLHIAGQARASAEAIAAAQVEFRKAETTRVEEITEQLNAARVHVIQLQNEIVTMKKSENNLPDRA